MKYIVKNCPCLMTSFYSDGTKIEYECGNDTEDRKCYECSCKLRELTDGALLEYITPEQTLTSENEDDKETHLIKCAKHNMAVMILGTLGYEEVQ